jgi:hypothetical protein
MENEKERFEVLAFDINDRFAGMWKDWNWAQAMFRAHSWRQAAERLRIVADKVTAAADMLDAWMDERAKADR